MIYLCIVATLILLVLSGIYAKLSVIARLLSYLEMRDTHTHYLIFQISEITNDIKLLLDSKIKMR
ncbi:MAG TPA: hypothetical protein PLE30_09820 [Candidatus Kapabacteria bacterium]|nr:hypothetical protein [Candidatus Kapabacteria bacterium]